MKLSFSILFTLILSHPVFAQSGSIRGNQFQLTGTIIEEVQLTPHCGVLAWGTVIKFRVTKITGLKYPQENIGIIITCPEFYENGFFEIGKRYHLVFSDKNQADFGWVIPNKDLLKINKLAFDPYVVDVKKLK
jgi:hypothetical protein